MRISPSREEFRTLAAQFGVVPVWAEVLADRHTPVGAFMALVGDEPGFLLESVEHGERWARFSFVGCRPRAEISLVNGKLHTSGAVPGSVPTDKGFLAALEAMLVAHRAPVMPELPPLQGGMIGHIGYDIVREIEHLPNPPADDRNIPDAVMSMIGSLAAFDHWRQRAYLIESVPTLGLHQAEVDTAYDAAVLGVQRMAHDLSRAVSSDVAEPPNASDRSDTPTFLSSSLSSPLSSSLPDGRYQAAVRVAKEHIVAGDIFQVVLSQRFAVQLDADPFDFYRVLRQINPSPYMYFVRHEALTVAGSSPEPLVQVRDGRVISRPIAGTRKRGRDDDHDRRLAGELRENPKERAEHVMLVDLARNDVGRIAKFGTVQLDELMTLERYSHVMHLTSQVSGELRDGLGPIDVLRATLPAGTVSGAPKVRAMQIIDALEPVRRGPYAGIVGYVDFNGNLDAAIAIRTMFAQGNSAWFQAGAGIVADSDPDDENLECHNKVAALVAALPAARRMTAQRRAKT